MAADAAPAAADFEALPAVNPRTTVDLLLSLYLCATSVYVLCAVACLAARRPLRAAAAGARPPITLIKPLHGDEPELYVNLLSFCQQDYAAFQVIFGVASGHDAAADIARQVIAACPGVDASLVINDRSIGSNRKISNVANCHEFSKHDLLVIADSDMRAPVDYLQHIANTFSDPDVMAGTCLYRGRAVGGLASWLGAAFINEWFLPSVLVAIKLRPLHFCFGATMAIRRATLQALGGFERLANELADDFRLGDWVAAQYGRVALIPCLVENTVHERSLRTLLKHELRWARTVRSVQPLGYALSFLTYCVPAALALAVNIGSTRPVLGVLIVVWAVGLRALVHEMVRICLAPAQPTAYLLSVLRDILCFGVWAMSFFGREVEWQGYAYAVDQQGQLDLKGTIERP